MWPRVVELMLGVWLAISPFVFQHDPDDLGLWCNDLICAFLVILLSLASFSNAFQFAHVGTLLPALWLMVYGYSTGPAPPALQNDLIVGLLLVMLAIIPNEASQPPHSWRALRDKSSDRAS